MIIVFSSSFLALIDGGGMFFIPVIFGSFIVYQFYEEKQRVKFLVYFLPFIFLAIFFTAGGGLFIIQRFDFESMLPSDLQWIFVGIWSSYIILISVWALFKVKIKFIHFVLLTILIPIPYSLGLDGIHERDSIYFFCFLWNTMLSIVLSLMFSQKKKHPNNISLFNK
ncbi:MAG: hypothetical protein EOO96_21710 [Pedobacter sp.]|nr:MAG: hypothetical protein EOO96_21710 [Pedobacter sp.]